jgi:two-component system, chemotaxis family, CheB/CheR fusion protein
MRFGGGRTGGAFALPCVMLHADQPLRGIAVLVAEDDPDSLDALQQALEYFGARVVGAASAEEARRLVAAAPPDVLVTDIELGRESGVDLLAWLRAQRSAGINRVPAIAITGHHRHVEAPNADIFADWLLKPLRVDALCAAILRASVGDRHRERRRA